MKTEPMTGERPMPVYEKPSLAASAGNPFPGLRPFREDEGHLFFGRENQVDRMVDKLARTRFLAVVGSSGSGKSSLVNCGLRPALHRGLMARAGTSWRMAQFRPGSNPLRSMAEALARDGVLFTHNQGDGPPLVEIVETTLRMSKLGLIDVYEQAQLGAEVNLLVVVDQFEEVFRYRDTHANSEQAMREASQDVVAFVNLLREAESQTEQPIHIVLTMRSDFLGDCAQIPGLPEAINEGQYLVPRMTRDERRAAIAGPVAVGGGEISPVLLTRLVNDVGDNPDQLSILQHALNRSWAYWKRFGVETGPISLEHYQAIGTMAHALDRHAEGAFAELETDRKKKICEKLFKVLSDKGSDARGIRRPTRFARLLELTGATDTELIEVIDVFRKPSRSFLMPPLPEKPGPDTVIDISHESLMRVWERLKAWADEEAQSAQMYRRVTETAALYAAKKAGLWRDPDLQLALDWRSREGPTAAWAQQYRGDFPAAMAFLDSSKAERDYEKAEEEFERRWRRPWTFIAVGILASFFIISAQYSQNFESWLHDAIAGGPSFETTISGREPFFHRILAITILGTSHLVAFVTLAWVGRRIYRATRFERIRWEVAHGPALPPEPELHAGFFRRAMAALIDGSVVLVAMVALLFILSTVDGIAGSASMVWAWPISVIIFVWLYSALFTHSHRQGTPGKSVMGIIVQDRNGARLSFRRASARVLAKLPSCILGIGFLIQPFTRQRQALHDILAGTAVVRRRQTRSYPTASHAANGPGGAGLPARHSSN